MRGNLPMKKKNIGFITTNKVFAQSFAATMGARRELEYNLYLFLNPHQAAVDAEIMKTDIAVVDVVNESSKSPETFLSFCEKLRKDMPECHILLIVSQEDKQGCETVIRAVKDKIADDFVFYDNSLEYLFAKLAAF